MQELIIFYDDAKAGCTRYAEQFAKYQEVDCRKASEYQKEKLIFATGARVGFVFESENGQVPYAISHIIWRMIADKKREHMIFVTGGSREFQAIRTAREDLEQRGYRVGSIYIRYLFEKYRLKEEETAGWLLKDMETGQSRADMRKKYESMSHRELVRYMRRELKEYKKYKQDK